MRSVTAAGIVLPAPRVLSRVIGLNGDVTCGFESRVLESGLRETGISFDRDDGSGVAREFCGAGCTDAGSVWAALD
jgi:hypothetical protein